MAGNGTGGKVAGQEQEGMAGIRGGGEGPMDSPRHQRNKLGRKFVFRAPCLAPVRPDVRQVSGYGGAARNGGLKGQVSGKEGQRQFMFL